MGRKSFSLKRKVEIIRFHDENPKLSKAEIAVHFDLPRTTVVGIINKRRKILDQFHSSEINPSQRLWRRFFRGCVVITVTTFITTHPWKSVVISVTTDIKTIIYNDAYDFGPGSVVINEVDCICIATFGGRTQQSSKQHSGSLSLF